MRPSSSITCAVLAAVAALCLAIASAPAQKAEPTTVRPEQLKLNPSPTGGGVLSATALGNPIQGGAIYVVYVKYPVGTKSLPHMHPDQRIFTVISGTFYAGVGTEFDEKNLVALKPGSIMAMPAKVVHYGWAKDGDVIMQEVGLGPSGTELWAPAK